jgi:hypothetical protein
VTIGAGDYHSTALRADGTVVAWGRYYTGGGYILPVVPAGLTNVLAIAAGSDHDLALLGEAPFILVQPVSLRVTIGSNATFGVTVTALPPPTFQWRMDGVDVSGATASVLGLTGIGPGAGGFYSVAVSNKFGVLSSSNALLTINYPPVADASATALEVLSANGTNAAVVLDSSRSSDQDGDLLQFLWSDASNGKPLATGIVAVITLPLGTNGITLSVNDGLVSVQQTILVRVVSIGQVVADLIDVIDQVVSKPGPLVAMLSAALASINRGNFSAAVEQLGAFRNMVKAQVAPLDPSLAGRLIRSAQSIAQILSGAAAPRTMIAIHRQAGGKICLQLSSRPARTCIIETSSNLVEWEAIGSAPGDDGGSFEFEVPNSGGLPSRYYRLVQP